MTNTQLQQKYAALLDQQGIKYSNHQGFYVRIPLKNTKSSFTHVCDIHDGKILLADYRGDCCTGIRAANRLAKAIQKQFPEFDIVVEKYSIFEIVVYKWIQFDSIDALHQEVLSMATVVDEGARLGKEMLGEDFER